MKLCISKKTSICYYRKKRYEWVSFLIRLYLVQLRHIVQTNGIFNTTYTIDETRGMNDKKVYF